MTTNIKIDRQQLSNFLKDSNGPVLRSFLVVGEAIKMKTVASLKEGFPQEFLGPSVVKRFTAEKDGPHVFVGSERTKTRPHPINGNPLLVFYWPKAGHTVYLRHVNHPGSDFSKYLEKKLLEALVSVKGIIR